MSILKRYMHWLHTRWPAGHVEKLPEVNEDGTTRVPGLRVVGDLTGVPLLKFAVDSGAKAVAAIAGEADFSAGAGGDGVVDIAIVGGGLSGISAAIEAKRRGMSFEVFEAADAFATIKDFPKGKPIYTYPTEMTPAGELTLTANVKEDLVAELERQRAAAGIEVTRRRIEDVKRDGKSFVLRYAGGASRAQRVIVAIGRSGNFRKLGVAGEELDKVYKRLHDPMDFKGKCVLVVGGGDSALESSIALAVAGASVTHSYRGSEFSRAKPENVEKLNALVRDPSADVGVEEPTSERVTTAFSSEMCSEHGAGRIRLAFETDVAEIREGDVVLKSKNGGVETIPNDVVFAMIGREPPLAFFRKVGVPIRGEMRAKQWVTLAIFLLFCVWMYHWKSDYLLGYVGLQGAFNKVAGLNPGALWDRLKSGALGSGLGAYLSKEGTLGQTLAISASGRSFYYTLAYCVCVVVFGVRRIRRRKTPYVKLQTMTLAAIQIVPLFLLPEIILPWLGHNGAFDSGLGKSFADAFFPMANWGHGREYWRAIGFVLAWPLVVGNWFTDQPLWGWLSVGGIQTFVVIPLLVRRWGKGAYCGWICSCGALAETMGDAHRHKMPHGPKWNRLNMIGQGFLAFAIVIMLFRILGWMGAGWATHVFDWMSKKAPIVSYGYMVDLLFAGILGVGLYFHFSGRVWCRFACPLAALMHIYARFSRFRIFADKKKCISCNVCTSVCHQGIDVMNFANKGAPMEDPECVRCSACVQSCPTGVLSFGRFDRAGNVVHDRLTASLVRVEEVGLPKRTVR
ncbi:MAG: NAD(P)-binding domain-containing protein [Phycisphaerales bacterium]|nr:NAD(P)-binding domain-containing protein [Phycisphaerales bacterium]MCB9857232.1 NAD(P)-binding domain-containing protein [Phycisphaerales bacterium]MCB9863054.1 NAD(P)-binding domain-containing protein [Phycisphaerales bacterium]